MKIIFYVKILLVHSIIPKGFLESIGISEKIILR